MQAPLCARLLSQDKEIIVGMFIAEFRQIRSLVSLNIMKSNRGGGIDLTFLWSSFDMLLL